MKQIRLRLDLATRRTRRALEQRRRTLLTETDCRKAAAEGDVYLLLRWREDTERAQHIYEEFYDRYDSLIGLVCLAAHQGIEPHLEEEFRERRAWFVSNYPQRVQPLIARYLETDAADTVSTIWGRRACDLFEALYQPQSIAALLEADGGNLIGRMMRAQRALGAWEEHLRRASDAAAVPIRFN